MSKLNATASINFAKTKIKWSSLKAHNHRNYYDMKHDKNKNINHNLSKYNLYGTYFNYYKFMTPYVDKSKLAKQRSKYIKQRRKSRARKFASPKAFLQSKHHRNCRCGIVTLGDHNFQNKLEKALKKRFPGISTKDIKLIERARLKGYLDSFNKRHKYIRVISWAIHEDEAFQHAHAEFIGIPGRTKTGKLQLNFNKALRLEMANQKERKAFQKDHSYKHLPNNKVALHRFQSEEDKRIIGPALHHDFGVQLVRKGASKDDQRQHSLAVSESAKASSYASIASSSASYLMSLNADFRASLSESAEKSLKSKKRALASSAQSLSTAETKFDISAYGGYARQLSNVLTPYMPSQSSGIWIQYATGMKYIKSSGKRVNNPLSLAGSISASKATSANDTYNSIQDTNLSLKDENLSLKNENNNLSRQITGKRSTLSKLDDKIKRAKDKIHGIYSGAVFNLLNDVIPDNDRRFNGLKRRGMGSLGYKTNKGFDATKLMGVANGNSSISINHRHYHGLSAVFHIIGYDIKHTINKEGTDKAKEDSKAKAKRYDEKAKAQSETNESAEISQIQARANDNGPSWGE